LHPFDSYFFKSYSLLTERHPIGSQKGTL